MDGTLAESTKRLALRDAPHAASGRDDESSGWIERGRIDDYNRGREKGRELATIDPRGNADRLRQSGWASWGITPSDTAASVTHSSLLTPRKESKFARVVSNIYYFLERKGKLTAGRNRLNPLVNLFVCLTLRKTRRTLTARSPSRWISTFEVKRFSSTGQFLKNGRLVLHKVVIRNSYLGF